MQNNEQKIASAHAYKEKGNEWFKSGNFKKALVQYNTAIAFTKGLPGRNDGLEGVSQMALQSVPESEKINDEAGVIVKELDVVLKTNIATCHIKLNNSGGAVEAAKHALRLKPDHWKASLRLAEANLMTNDVDKTMAQLDETTRMINRVYSDANGSSNFPANAIETAHTAVARLREKAIKVDKVAQKKQKKAFGGVFERLARETHSKVDIIGSGSGEGCSDDKANGAADDEKAVQGEIMAAFIKDREQKTSGEMDTSS